MRWLTSVALLVGLGSGVGGGAGAILSVASSLVFPSQGYNFGWPAGNILLGGCVGASGGLVGGAVAVPLVLLVCSYGGKWGGWIGGTLVGAVLGGTGAAGVGVALLRGLGERGLSDRSEVMSVVVAPGLAGLLGVAAGVIAFIMLDRSPGRTGVPGKTWNAANISGR